MGWRVLRSCRFSVPGLAQVLVPAQVLVLVPVLGLAQVRRLAQRKRQHGQ